MPLYFAFGSNMDAAQMSKRCPGSRSLGLASLSDHRLVFRGPSKNRGQGVLSVDPHQGSQVRGLLWELHERHIHTLDRIEGAPQWYERVGVQVRRDAGAERGPISAILYRLPSEVTEMAPTDAYAQQVRRASDSLGLGPEGLNDALARAVAAAP